MNNLKTKSGISLFLFSAAAIAATWYLPFKVPGTFAADKQGGEFANAANIFDQNQLEMISGQGATKKGDFVDALYEDGTIAQFILGDPSDCMVRCTWSDVPFGPNPKPNILQGKWPFGKQPPLGKVQVIEGQPMPIVGMSLNPTSLTPVYSISIVQYGGGCDLCESTSTGGGGGGGSGGSGGGSGGGSDPAPPKCTEADCDGGGD